MQSHTEIAIASIKCFTDDGTLDLKELNYLLGLALRDKVIDDEEKRVLGNIFSKITESDVDAQVWARIVEVKADHNF